MILEGRTVLDEGGDIQGEYARHLFARGQPGVGDRFFQMILQSQPDRVERIALPRSAATGQYTHFPTDPTLAAFDQSDRVFAAAALASGCPVVNAVDSDWAIHEARLVANGVTIEFLCGRALGRHRVPAVRRRRAARPARRAAAD